MGETEEATDAVQHRVDRGDPQPGVAEVSNAELDVGALDAHQRVQGVGLAPGEPAAQLIAVEGVSVPEYRARYERAASWAGDIASDWNGRSMVLGMTTSGGLATMSKPRTAAHGETTCDDARPPQHPRTCESRAGSGWQAWRGGYTRPQAAVRRSRRGMRASWIATRHPAQTRGAD